MKKKFKNIMIILLVIVILSIILYQFNKLNYYKSEEYRNHIIIDSFFENYFNKDEIRYKMEFNYGTSEKLQEAPWGISLSQLKFLEKQELLEENDKTLKYKGNTDFITFSKERTINYYFNESDQFYSVKIDIIVEKKYIPISLFNVLVSWVEELYLTGQQNTEGVTELSWEDEFGVEHGDSTIPYPYSIDHFTEIRKIMNLKDEEKLDVEKLVFDNNLVYKLTLICNSVKMEILTQKYNEEYGIINCTITNEKLLDK